MKQREEWEEKEAERKLRDEEDFAAKLEQQEVAMTEGKAGGEGVHEEEMQHEVWLETGHEWLGQQVQRAFDGRRIRGTIVAWLPPTAHEAGLWKNRYWWPHPFLCTDEPPPDSVTAYMHPCFAR
jgi:hypothetical protein